MGKQKLQEVIRSLTNMQCECKVMQPQLADHRFGGKLAEEIDAFSKNIISALSHK